MGCESKVEAELNPRSPRNDQRQPLALSAYGAEVDLTPGTEARELVLARALKQFSFPKLVYETRLPPDWLPSAGTAMQPSTVPRQWRLPKSRR